jgi:trehalose 6-phosphate phosphatase
LKFQANDKYAICAMPVAYQSSYRDAMSTPLRSPTALSPLLAAERLGILTDFDGTIAPLTIRPGDAAISESARLALEALVERLPLVGVMSGRALFDLRSKIDLPHLLYIGSHGLAWWYDGIDELPDAALPYADLAERVAAELEWMRALPWLRFEEKGIGLAFHYRLATDPAPAREAILSAIADCPVAKHFEIREGIFVVELYPRLHVDKGSALRNVVSRFSLDGLLYLGDDLTDVDAMYAVTELRRDLSSQAVSIAVRHAEAPALASEAADWTVDGVAGVERVLEWLVEQTNPPSPPAGPGEISRGGRTRIARERT